MRRLPIIVILLFATLARLVQISHPVGGVAADNQRHALASAYDISLHGFHSLPFPEDISPTEAQVRDTGFPLFASLLAIMFKLFTPCDTSGRILSLVFSLAALAGLFVITRRLIDRRTALWAMVIGALLPFNIYFGRTGTPAMLSLALALWGIAAFQRWAFDNLRGPLIISALLILLAALGDAPLLCIVVPVAMLAYQARARHGSRILMHAIFTLIVLVPLAAWHVRTGPVAASADEFLGIPANLLHDAGALFSLRFWGDVVWGNIAGDQLTYPGMLLFLIGVAVPRRGRGERVFDFWAGGAALSLLAANGQAAPDGASGLWFAIPASVFIGKALGELLSPDTVRHYWRSKRAVLVVVVIAAAALPFASALRVAQLLELETARTPSAEAGAIVQRLAQNEGKIVAVGAPGDDLLYACRRDGWMVAPDDLSPSLATRFHFAGSSWLVGAARAFNAPASRERLYRTLRAYPAEVATDSFFIVRLSMMPGSSPGQ